MSARKKRWVMRDPAPPEFIAGLPDHDPVVASLLYQRGLRDPHSIAAFLSPDYRGGLHDPFLMKGMEEAARRVAAAVAAGEPIAVYGDFDADGVTAVTLLMQAISAMGGDIRPYIPHRVREGYGLNDEAAERLAAEGVRLLITVDCGISNVAEVARARACGLDVIVTDHHTPPEVLPDALAVVNPKQPGCAYPYKQLVGVGIAYKLVQALSRLGLRSPLRGRDLLDVVALGTVTDLGPLTGENRILVQKGLEAINESPALRPGLRALLDSAGLLGSVKATDISFMLGPRLNAAGRLDDAVLSYKLLLADDIAEARRLAGDLHQANRRRQELTKEVQTAASEQVRAEGKQADRVIVLAGADYPAGVVGLVAARLVEEFGRPVLLVERGEELSRGSARSLPGFNIIEALTSCADLFVRFGGHSAAAGFTLANERLPELERRLHAYAEQRLPDELLSPMLELDTEVPLASLTMDLLAKLESLEPFGQANPQPVLMSRQVRVLDAQTRGGDRQHLRLRLSDGNGGPPHEAIGFRLGHLVDYFARAPWLDIAYTLEANEWNGARRLRLNIKDLRRAQSA